MACPSRLPAEGKLPWTSILMSILYIDSFWQAYVTFSTTPSLSSMAYTVHNSVRTKNKGESNKVWTIFAYVSIAFDYMIASGNCDGMIIIPFLLLLQPFALNWSFFFLTVIVSQAWISSNSFILDGGIKPDHLVFSWGSVAQILEIGLLFWKGVCSLTFLFLFFPFFFRWFAIICTF